MVEATRLSDLSEGRFFGLVYRMKIPKKLKLRKRLCRFGVFALSVLFYWINDRLLGGCVQYYLSDGVRLLFSGFEGILFGLTLFLSGLAGLAYIASTKVSHPIIIALLMVTLVVFLCGLDYTVRLPLIDRRVDREFQSLLMTVMVVAKAVLFTFLALRSYHKRQLKVHNRKFEGVER